MLDNRTAISQRIAQSDFDQAVKSCLVALFNHEVEQHPGSKPSVSTYSRIAAQKSETWNEER
jgi:hypothetical protein